MYQLYVENDDSFEPEMIGEFEVLEDAQKAAKEAKAKDSSIYYEIKETNGGFNSYGDLIATTVEKG